jgi:hypothetical protein
MERTRHVRVGFGGETWQGRRHSQSAHERGRESGGGGTRAAGWPNYAGRGPKGYKRSDDRIREEISDRLMDDHEVDATEIEVQVEGGEVTLAGTVASRDQKRRAEELAERCNGVSDVTNNLRVNRQAAGEAGQQSASQAWQTPQSTQQGGQTAGQAGVGTQVSGGTSAPASSKPSRTTTPSS